MSTSTAGPAAGRAAGEPRTAFVLAGGAVLGAMQAGMVHALYERGIAPDLLIATSAGALNAAFLRETASGNTGTAPAGLPYRRVRSGPEAAEGPHLGPARLHPGGDGDRRARHPGVAGRADRGPARVPSP